jgi:tetratricopeptide (TPR) repeat protein
MNQIGVQINATTVNFGGEQPSKTEREGLQQLIEERFSLALERGTIGGDDRASIEASLRRLFATGTSWTEHEDVCLLGVRGHELADLQLPVEWLGRPPSSTPVVVRCELVDTETIPERAQRPETTRIVLATAGDSVPHRTMQATMLVTCSRGLLDFDEQRDHLQEPSKADLGNALEDASVLLLACRVGAAGLLLRGHERRDQAIDSASLTELLLPFAGDLRLVVLLPVHDGDAFEDPGRAIVEVAAALHRAGLAAVVAPRVPLPPAALPQVTGALVEALLGDGDTPPLSLEHAVARANLELAAHESLAGLRLRLYARAGDGDDTRPIVIRPYRGLLSFDRDHARFFGGRDEQIAEALARIDEFTAQGSPRFLLLVGPSGVGKSSLAKAGVLPKLVARGHKPMLTRPSDGFDLAELLPARGPSVLVIDQLEELLASTDTPALEAASLYLQQLWRLAGDERGTIVIATMRIDALESGGALVLGKATDETPAHSLEKLVQSRHWQYVAHLDPAQLESVITGPARRVGLTFTEGLVDRLCTDALSQPGALPMLAVVLDRLWAHRSGRTLRAAKYEGGLAATLTEHANECLAKLHEDRRAQAKRILVRMAIDPDARIATWRRRTRVAELRPSSAHRQAAFDDAVAALVERRLVVCGDFRATDGSGARALSTAKFEGIEPTRIEFAHELLLRRWKELSDWVRADRPRLTAVSSLGTWVAEYRARGTLLTGEQLAYIDSVLPDDDDDISAAMAQLLEASRQHILRQSWIRRGLVGFMGATAVVLAALSMELYQTGEQLQRESEELAIARNVADEKAQLAEARLADSIALAETILEDVVPKLAKHPAVRPEKQEILESLSSMLLELGVPDLRVSMLTHRVRGDEARYTADLAIARTEYLAALRIAESLVAKDPHNAEDQLEMANLLRQLGFVELSLGNVAEARENYEQALKIAEGQSGPAAREAVIALLLDLGWLEQKAGKSEVARAHFERGVKLSRGPGNSEPVGVEAQRLLSSLLTELGSLDVYSGKLDSARARYEEALDLAERFVQADPSADAKQDLLEVLYGLAAAEVRLGESESARKRYSRILETAEQLRSSDPNSMPAKRELWRALLKFGDGEARAGQLENARATFERALPIAEDVANADPDNMSLQEDLSMSLERLGRVEMKTGKLEQAHAHHVRALVIAQNIAETSQASADARRSLAISLSMLADVEVKMGSLSKAWAGYERALQIAEELAAENPISHEAKREAAMYSGKLGDIAIAAGKWKEARIWFERALESDRQRVELDPNSIQAKRDMDVSVSKLGDVALKLGDLEEAREWFTQSLELTEELAKKDPSNRRNLFLSLLKMGDVEVDAGNLEVAREHLERALQISQEMTQADPTNTAARRDQCVAMARFGDLAAKMGKLDEARQRHEASLEIREEIARADPTNGEASFDLVNGHLNLLELAERSRDKKSVALHLAAAQAQLEQMQSRDQIDGFADREAVRSRLARLAAKRVDQ